MPLRRQWVREPFGSNTLVPNLGVDAPVFKPDGVTGAGASPTANAQLFLVTGSIRNPTYAPLFPSTTFRPSPQGMAQAYVIPPQQLVTVPGVPCGAFVTVVLRAWEGASYDAATVRGQSNPITFDLGGCGTPPDPFATLTGLQGFVMVPEPSVVALGLLSFAVSLYRRQAND